MGKNYKQNYVHELNFILIIPLIFKLYLLKNINNSHIYSKI